MTLTGYKVFEKRDGKWIETAQVSPSEGAVMIQMRNSRGDKNIKFRPCYA